jgi:hypothetical protein
MKFLAPGNYEISGPFTERRTTRFCKGLSRISKGRKFRNFWPPEILSGPESKFPALKSTLLWMILSLSTVVLFPTSLHHQSCAIPGEFLQCLAQD